MPSLWAQKQLNTARSLPGRWKRYVHCEGAGEVEEKLRTYKQEHSIVMLVMGAYGHSRIRHLLVSSTTTSMQRNSQLPVLTLR